VTINFPVWGFYCLGAVGAIISVGLISWVIMRIERWFSKRSLDKALRDK